MIITIANSKGGSGKSTIALNLAIAFNLNGAEVLVIDTDSQKSTEKFSNIRALESEDSNTKFKAHFTCVSRGGNGVTEMIKNFVNKFNIIIIDTPAGKTQEQRKALLLSDVAIIPTTASQIDASEILEMFNYMREIRDFNENLATFVLFNRINPNPFLANEAQELREFLTQECEKEDIKILDSIIHDRVDYKRSIANGLGVCELDSRASEEFNEVFNEISKILNKETK